MRTALLLILALSLSACGGAQALESGLSGKPQEHRFTDGVRCYTYTSGSVACVVVK